MEKPPSTIVSASSDGRATPTLAELTRSLLTTVLQAEALQLAQQNVAWDLQEAFGAERVYLIHEDGDGAVSLQAQAGVPPSEEELERLRSTVSARKVAQGAHSTLEFTPEGAPRRTMALFHAPLRIAAQYAPVLCLVKDELTKTELSQLNYLVGILAPALGSAYRQEGLATDIAEARRLVHDTKAEQRAKNAFLARMSHDLRTPLSVILGFAQLLELEPLAKKQSEHVRQILHSSRQLNALIGQVLELTSLDSGKLTMQLVPVRVSEALARCLSQLMPQAREKQIKVSIIDPEGPAPYAYADPHRLEQILLNLLSNAIKYNVRKGTITVAYRATDDRRVRIEVSDTGPGVPRSLIPKIFEPFERLNVGADIEGTGLGLALSRVLADALGGTLAVESQMGRGSTFILELPVTDPEE